jgi:hypothetical protein
LFVNSGLKPPFFVISHAVAPYRADICVRELWTSSAVWHVGSEFAVTECAIPWLGNIGALTILWER